MPDRPLVLRLGGMLVRALTFCFRDFVLGLLLLLTHPYMLSLALIRSIGAFNWSADDLVDVKYADSIFRIGSDASTMLGINKVITGLSAGISPLVTERFISSD